MLHRSSGHRFSDGVVFVQTFRVGVCHEFWLLGGPPRKNLI